MIESESNRGEDSLIPIPFNRRATDGVDGSPSEIERLKLAYFRLYRHFRSLDDYAIELENRVSDLEQQLRER